ncbi:MAG: hypothetical protein ACKPKO_29390, partial [Candidatus Fonsibacter sp.]
EQHDNIVATKLIKHFPDCMFANLKIDAPRPGIIQWHALLLRQALICKQASLDWGIHVCH